MIQNETITYYQSMIESPIFASLSESSQNEIREKLQEEMNKALQGRKQEIIESIADHVKSLVGDDDIELSLLVTYNKDKVLAVREYYPEVIEEEIEDEEEIVEVNNDGVPNLFAEEEFTEQKKKSIKNPTEGFSVYFPEDDTTICEHDAVDTFILAIKKIGLARVAEVGIKHVGYNLVSITERPHEGKTRNPWQKKVEGLFVYTNIGNERKIADLMDISDYFSLHLKIESTGLKHGNNHYSSEESKEGNDSPEHSNVSTVRPQINEEAKYYSLPIKEQAHMFMEKHVADRTASSYISVLDNAVRRFISEKIDSAADSIFSYTTVEDVELVIEMLNDDDDFKKENEKRHNSMTAALNLYLKFIKSRENIE